MDRSNYGWGSGSSSSSSGGGGSSRKGKKDKQRQPQRGLGVAQLEKIRLQSEMAEYTQLPSIQSPFSNLNMSDARVSVPVSLSPSQTYPPRTTVQMPLVGGATRGGYYSEAPYTSTVRPLLNAPSNIYQANVHGNPAVTLPLFEGDREDYARDYEGRWSTGSRSPNSNSSETQDLDLELKL